MNSEAACAPKRHRRATGSLRARGPRLIVSTLFTLILVPTVLALVLREAREPRAILESRTPG